MFDMDQFRAEFNKAADVADGVRAAQKVKAQVVKQAGAEVLAARCPKCRTLAALSGPGKHLCRTCHQWLEYVREE
jgi:hypothetical protein